MMRISLRIFTGWAGSLVGLVAVVGLAAQPAGAACQGVDEMTEKFLSVYPTGGHVARFDGDPGDQVMRALATGRDADEVVFLYSGNGPVTGARGRYMYLLLDTEDCILHSDWIDGETFDRVVPAQ